MVRASASAWSTHGLALSPSRARAHGRSASAAALPRPCGARHSGSRVACLSTHWPVRMSRQGPAHQAPARNVRVTKAPEQCVLIKKKRAHLASRISDCGTGAGWSCNIGSVLLCRFSQVKEWQESLAPASSSRPVADQPDVHFEHRRVPVSPGKPTRGEVSRGRASFFCLLLAGGCSACYAPFSGSRV